MIVGGELNSCCVCFRCILLVMVIILLMLAEGYLSYAWLFLGWAKLGIEARKHFSPKQALLLLKNMFPSLKDYAIVKKGLKVFKRPKERAARRMSSIFKGIPKFPATIRRCCLLRPPGKPFAGIRALVALVAVGLPAFKCVCVAGLSQCPHFKKRSALICLEEGFGRSTSEKGSRPRDVVFPC